jgi:hypothetical protein
LLSTIVAALPAAVALSIWKKTGTGQVPVFSGGGRGGGGNAPGAVAHNTHKYLNIDFHHLSVNLHDLGQTFWSVRLLEFLLLAGTFGLIARARWKGAFVVAWFVTFALIKGTVSYANVYDTSLYRFLLPAWPAWTLIVAGVVFCWPRGNSRRASQHTGEVARLADLRSVNWYTLIGVALVLSVGPFLVITADSAAKPGAIVQENYTGAPIPAVDFGLQARQVGPHAVSFTWKRMATKRAKTTYVIFKAGNNGCDPRYVAIHLCRFRMQFIGSTHGTTFVDTQAVTRRFYRIGLAEGSVVQVDYQSFLLMSKPVSFAPK